LHGGVIACVEQINDLSSDAGVAIGFFDANALRECHGGPLVHLPAFIVHGQVPETCVRLPASNSISDLYLISRGDYHQVIFFDPVFGQKAAAA
jgi:hypothetical protein